MAERIDSPIDPPSSAPAAPVSGGHSADEIDELLGGYEGQRPGETVLPAAQTPAMAAGSAGGAAASSRAPVSASTPRAQRPRADLSELGTWWWLPTLLVPLLGGTGAYLVLKGRRPLAARVLFGVGLALGVIASILFVQHAADLAAYTNRLQSDTVITQPSSTVAR
jgi:hypothetical protein